MLRVVYCHFAPISPAHVRNWVYLCFQRSIWPTLTFGGAFMGSQKFTFKGRKIHPKKPTHPNKPNWKQFAQQFAQTLSARLVFYSIERGRTDCTNSPENCLRKLFLWGVGVLPLNCCSAGSLLRSTHFGALWRLFLRSLTPEPFPKNHLRLFFLKITSFFFSEVILKDPPKIDPLKQALK